MPPFETYPGDKAKDEKIKVEKILEPVIYQDEPKLDPVYCVPMEKVEPAEVCGPVNVPKSAPAREKLTISKLIELRELLDGEIKCHEEVDTRTSGVEFSPGLKNIINRHWDECQNKLDWIEKVFTETVVEVPSDQAI